ncbi:MAG: SLC13 family permease [Gammaproteobacteria bacterium]|nr:SLC13 family permease [Gammaproteobacteria bacterium]
MSLDAWIVVATLAAMLGTLIFTSLATDVVMMAALSVLLLSGILVPALALGGFANEGVATVGVLYVVVAGLRDTGVITWIAQGLFGRPQSVAGAQLRMMAPIAAISAFMNNTPLVAAMLPAVTEWSKKHQIPVSKLLMPLSFATILGGLCTLIGTSTNVIVAGLMKDAVKAGEIDRTMGFFTLTWVGVPCALAGLAYILLTSRWLLPTRQAALRRADDPRAYTVEMIVEPGGGIVGKTIEAAGLRHLHEMYLAEVEREGEIIAAVGPQLRLESNDHLIFVGVVDSIVELQRTRGLIAATNQVFKLDGPRAGRTLIEAVVSDRCPLVGKSIRDGRFRTQYNAAVIAVARSGERLQQKIGDIVLTAGDTLLLEARPAFVQQQRNSQDFYLVSNLDDSSPLRHDKAMVALAILLGMITLATAFEQLPFFIAHGFGMFHAALIAAGCMIATRCCSTESARRAVDWSVLIVIAATIGIGKAVEATGLAAGLAQGLVALAGTDPMGQLVIIYFTTMILTELLSNNSAAVLMFPIGLATAATLGVNYMPFVVALTIAASCGFATPIGYQTNLMVYGPGGYHFSDYVRFGAPLNVLVGVVTLLVTPFAFPFR